MHLTISTLISISLVLPIFSAWELSHRSISPFLTLTYVHGGEDARLSHLEAREFCRNLLDRIEEMSEKNKSWASANPHPWKDLMSTSSPSSTPSPSSSSSSSSPSPSSITTPSPEKSSNHSATAMVHSDLISLHDPTMVHELMGWVLSLEPKQFWIGGLIKMVKDKFREEENHLIQLWTDRTPPNFRLMHFDNPEFRYMDLGEVKCLAVDYASGKWGAHDCDERMYFVCETIRLPKTSSTIKPVSGTTKRTKRRRKAKRTTTQLPVTEPEQMVTTPEA